MSWRTIVISNQCKLSYKNNHLLIRNEKLEMIHLSEINTIVIDTTQVSITSYLLTELMNNKIKIIFCDEKRSPIGEMVPYYGAHNTSKKILLQIKWDKNITDLVWANIVKCKIYNQATLLKKENIENALKIASYIDEVKEADSTNREGHAAKVYFNSLFGKTFSRDKDNNINAALDYGYSILLSNFNKEIISKGYITQIGINHKNEFNFFNLSCDLMEPFRILIDEYVYQNKEREFDKTYRYDLINILNNKVRIQGKEQFVSNAITIYVKSVFDAIENQDPNMVLNYEL